MVTKFASFRLLIMAFDDFTPHEEALMSALATSLLYGTQCFCLAMTCRDVCYCPRYQVRRLTSFLSVLLENLFCLVWWSFYLACISLLWVERKEPTLHGQLILNTVISLPSLQFIGLQGTCRSSCRTVSRFNTSRWK